MTTKEDVNKLKKEDIYPLLDAYNQSIGLRNRTAQLIRSQIEVLQLVKRVQLWNHAGQSTARKCDTVHNRFTGTVETDKVTLFGTRIDRTLCVCSKVPAFANI